MESLFRFFVSLPLTRSFSLEQELLCTSVSRLPMNWPRYGREEGGNYRGLIVLQDGINACVIDPFTIKPLDVELIEKHAKRYGRMRERGLIDK